jgi:hypothetical protein
MRVYPKVSGLTTWSEDWKWHSSLPLGANLWVSLLNSVAINLCVASQRVIPKVSLCFVIDSVRKLLDTPSYFLFIYLLISFGLLEFVQSWESLPTTFVLHVSYLQRVLSGRTPKLTMKITHSYRSPTQNRFCVLKSYSYPGNIFATVNSNKHVLCPLHCPGTFLCSMG